MCSRVGRALRALSANPQAAASLGVDVPSHKLHVFALSTLLCSLAGSFYAADVTYISPDAFAVGVSFNILLMAAIGGLATVWGAPVGAAFVVLLGQLLSVASGQLPSGMEATLLDVANGVILIAIMLFVPQGFTRAATDFARACFHKSRA
jgi:branched-chain amino acid transport system permease protein